MRGTIIIGAVAVLAVAGFAAVIMTSPNETSAVSAGLPLIDLAAGEENYAAYCATCHGADLEGEPDWQSPGTDGGYPAPPHDETGHTWHHDDAMLFDYTKFGGDAAMVALGLDGVNSGMPGFGDELTDAQIRDVLAWIASTWPDRIRAARAARSGS